jgi:hypothetical protein
MIQLKIEVGPKEILRTLVLVLMLPLVAWLCACGTSTTTGTDESGATAGRTRTSQDISAGGTLVETIGCKQWNGEAAGDGISANQDCIRYEYMGGGLLLIKHINAGFNCCPEIRAMVNVRADSLIIIEREIAGLCDCLCLFDLHYQILGLDPGVYRVTVFQEYLDQDDEPLDFSMDLISSSSGEHCVERDHYPWGYE